MTTDRSEKWFWTPRSFHNALGTRPSDGWHTRRVTTFDPARRLDQIDVAGLKSHAPIARGPLLIVKKGVRKTAAGQSQRPPPPPPRGLEEGGGGGQGGGEGWRRRGERETLPFLIPSLSLSLPLSLSLSLPPPGAPQNPFRTPASSLPQSGAREWGRASCRRLRRPSARPPRTEGRGGDGGEQE